MVYIALASAVSYAAPVQVLEYFAPAPVAYYALLRLQQVVSILSLSCPPSTLSRVVEYIAPAPAVYAAPAPVMVYLASYAAQAQVLEYFAPASSAYAGLCNCNREFHSLPVVPTVFICTCGGVLWRRHHNDMLHRACCTAPVLMYIALTGTREPSF